MIFLSLTLLATLLAMLPYNLEGRFGRLEKQSAMAGGYFLTNILLGVAPWLLMMSVGLVDFIALLTSFLNIGLVAAAIKSNAPDEGSIILDWARPTNIFRGATTYFIVPIRQSSQKESTKKVDFDVSVEVPFPRIGKVVIKGSFPFMIDGGCEEQQIFYDDGGTMRHFLVPYSPARVKEYILADRKEGVKAQYGTKIAQMMQQYMEALAVELSQQNKEFSWRELRSRIYGSREINGKLETFLFGRQVPDVVVSRVGWPDDRALNLGVRFLQIMIEIELPKEITNAEAEIGVENAQKEVERINAETTAKTTRAYLRELGVSEEKINSMSSKELVNLGLELKKLRLAEQAGSGAKVESVSTTFNLDISDSVKEALPTAAEIAKAILPFLKKETGKKE